MSSIVQLEPRTVSRSMWVWFAPVQAAAAFTILAVAAGGQFLRTWLLTALVWLMAMPLLVSLEAGLIAMMLFEPLRGVLRRAQYLFVDYAAQDPIHVLTPIVTLLAFLLLLRSRRLEMFVATPLAGAVSILAVLYVLEIFNPLQGGLLIGLAGALFMLVPLVWFYFGQSIDEKFINRALRLVIVLGIVTSAYGIYQLTYGYPAFEQYWIDNTDFYDSINVGHVRRALATFSSAEEWGRYAEVAAIAAWGFATGTKLLVKRMGWMICSVGLMGAVLLTGQRTAIFGLLIGIGTLILLGARSFPQVLARVGMLLLPIVLIASFVSAPSEDDMWNKSDNETVGTLLSHAQRGTLQPAKEESFKTRLENWTYLVTSVIPYRPLGAGLGAGSLGEIRFHSESELPAIDSFILVVAIACGFPGVLLFIWILGRAAWLSVKNARAPIDDGGATTRRIIAAIMPALILNSIFGLTFTLYSVAPLAWLFIGWISRETLRVRQATEREIFTI
ncbi:MAG: O-antigen ligase family protein [Pyrinomonadaceae bacterium]